ncbi:winged helix-turn-helix domain-containing protein [Helicobacter pylori]|uniref:winged helix-turn-helix domain-containing protein n=1 Tax=Helicobacter pylori TaxID=210 RepID=UPI001CC238A0|nr:winged helix-turn-helix domain-containing protein [Helicobacter pylori]
MTKVDAIKKVMEDNKGIVSWTILYNQIEKYYPSIRAPKEWEAGLRGVLYREIRNHKNFKKVGLSLYALLDYQKKS